MGGKNKIESIMSNRFLLFQEAVREDNIHEIKSLLSELMKLWDDDLRASERGIQHEMWPELITIKNQHGHTAMHILSESGKVEIAQFLGKFNRQSWAETFQVLVNETTIHNQEHIQSLDPDDSTVFNEIGLILQGDAAPQESTSFPVQMQS